MDHQALKWLANNKSLNRRQARWALELDGFEFQIIHRPGVKNGKPDAWCRRSEFHPEKGGQGNLSQGRLGGSGKHTRTVGCKQ